MAVQFDLVSPEKRLASLKVSEVQIPGADGDLTAMEGHAPLITTLRPGVLRAVAPEGTRAYAVTGGFAEIGASGVSVLAEQAIPVEEAGPVLETLVEAARAEVAATTGEARDAADRRLADTLALRAALAGH